METSWCGIDIARSLIRWKVGASLELRRDAVAGAGGARRICWKTKLWTDAPRKECAKEPWNCLRARVERQRRQSARLKEDFTCEGHPLLAIYIYIYIYVAATFRYYLTILRVCVCVCLFVCVCHHCSLQQKLVALCALQRCTCNVWNACTWNFCGYLYACVCKCFFHRMNIYAHMHRYLAAYTDAYYTHINIPTYLGTYPS